MITHAAADAALTCRTVGAAALAAGRGAGGERPLSPRPTRSRITPPGSPGPGHAHTGRASTSTCLAGGNSLPGLGMKQADEARHFANGDRND